MSGLGPLIASQTKNVLHVTSKVPAKVFRNFFGFKYGIFNKGQYFRIGVGRHAGRETFRAGGKFIEIITGRKHIDIKDLGPLKRYKK